LKSLTGLGVDVFGHLGPINEGKADQRTYLAYLEYLDQVQSFLVFLAADSCSAAALHKKDYSK
jgi:hypothetical protein